MPSAGIRAPRTARSASEKSEPYGPESLRFVSRYMQRDVEIGTSPLVFGTLADLRAAFDSTDKQGSFIGAMYAGTTNVAVELVREG
jgi:staphylococcal nuclease domain-containing protein 1